MKFKDLRKPFLRWAMTCPGDSTRWGPPRKPPAKMVKVFAESKREIPELLPAHPEGEIWRKKPAVPIGCPAHRLFGIPFARQTPTYLARLPQGRVLGPTIAVLTSGDRMLTDVSLDWGHPGLNHFAYRRFRLPRCRDFKGNGMVLACTGGDTYFHWLTDALPRLAVAAKARDSQWQPDWWIVNTLDKAFVRESLEHFGIPLSRVVPLDRHPHIRFTNLWVPSLPSEGSSGNPPPWVAEYLRAAVFSQSKPVAAPRHFTRRLWIDRSRCSARNPAMVGDSEKILQKAGFVPVTLERLPWIKQVRLFQEAEWIAGPHGAGFSGLLFSEKPKVFDIFESRYVNACYYTLSQLVDGVYHYAIVKTGKNLPFGIGPDLAATLAKEAKS